MSSNDHSIKFSMKPFQDLYQSKDWFKALQWLEKHQSELGEGLYQFNKGVIYLKLDQYPQARYHFEKAKVIGFDDPWVYKNIESIKTELGLQLVEPQSVQETLKTKVFSLISLDYLIMIFLCIFLLTLMYWIKKKIKKSFYVLSSLVLLAILLTFLLLNSRSENYLTAQSHHAIVLDQVSIYEGPSAIFEELGKLPPGIKITWSDLENGWGRVTTPVNFRGWIQFNEKQIKQL